MLAQLEENMKIETTSFAVRMYHYVDDFAGRMEKTLATCWEEIKALQEQILVLQQQDNLMGTWMDDIQRRLEHIHVS